MKILKLAVFFITLSISLCGFPSDSRRDSNNSKQVIVLMRHAEKPNIDFLCSLGQLNCQGLNRALALPRVLHAQFGKPDYLFAPDPAKKILDGCIGLNSYVRPLATIEPIGIQYDMPVNTPFGYNNFTDMADLLLSPQYHDSLIFVAWEHFSLYLMAMNIVEQLGGDPTIVPMWEENDYDSLYVITINWNNDKGTVFFTHEYQGLNNQSTLCSSPSWGKTEKRKPTYGKETIFIIPSAENNGFGQLNCKGLNRSLGLQNVLISTNPNISLTIDDFFASAPGLTFNPIQGITYYYQQALMTLEPAAISQTKPLWTLFAYNDSAGMARYITGKNFRSSTVAIAWDPTQIQQLATLIYTYAGGNRVDIPKGAPDFDTIYKITISRSSPPLFQKFSEALTPLATCPLPITS